MLMTRIRRKLHTESGFTLAEVLLAVLILVMVSAIVATGIPVAKNAYEKVVLASNAEVLLSTTISALRNELGTAQDIQTSSDSTIITYYSAQTGATSKICLNSDLEAGDQLDDPDGTVMFQRYAKTDLSSGGDIVRLVSSAASTGDLYVTYSSVSYENGIITFKGLSVNRESGATGLASRTVLSIRVISY